MVIGFEGRFVVEGHELWADEHPDWQSETDTL